MTVLGGGDVGGDSFMGRATWLERQGHNVYDPWIQALRRRRGSVTGALLDDRLLEPCRATRGGMLDKEDTNRKSMLGERGEAW